MKLILSGAAALLLTTGLAMAQSPSNATIQGGQTAPSNSAGAAGPATSTGQLNQTGVGPGTTQLPGDKAANQPTTAASGNAVATTPTTR